MAVSVSKILKDTEFKLDQFSQEQIFSLESSISVKADKNGKELYYVKCLIRDKEIKLTPEECVRQLYLDTLINEYEYGTDRIQLEYPVKFGREEKRADIVIFDKDRPTVPYIIVELKKPKLKDGKEQLKSYCNATGTPIGIWTNGSQISYYNRKDPNYFEDIPQKYSLIDNSEIMILINRTNKKNILEELKSLGAHEGTVYPEIENMAKYIKKNIKD